MLKNLILTAALASISTAGIASEHDAAGTEAKTEHHHKKKGERKAKFHKKMAEHHKKMQTLGEDAAADKVDHKGFFKKFAEIHKGQAEHYTKKAEKKDDTEE